MSRVSSRGQELLLPHPKARLSGAFTTFLALAIILHGLAYVSFLKFQHRLIRESTHLTKITLLEELPPPAPEKPKPKPPPPKMKPVVTPPLPAPRRRQQAKPAPPKLQLQETKFHPKPGPANPGAPPTLQSVPPTHGGQPSGSPAGVAGGKGGPESAGTSAAPPSAPILPDRKNPAVLSRCQPEYPDAAREQSIEGTVRLAVLVGRHGQILNIRVDESSGNSDLDEAAIQSVRRCWQFAPAIQNSQPVETWASFAIRFQLQ